RTRRGARRFSRSETAGYVQTAGEEERANSVGAVGWVKRSVPTNSREESQVPQYRRAQGNMFFFTVVLADRSSTLLVDQVDRLRQIYRTVVQRRPFETVAICILPDHLHAIWTLPEDDADFSSRWNLIKGSFPRG